MCWPVPVCMPQDQISELRGQLEQELKAHQVTRDSLAARDKHLTELKQQVI